MKNRKKNLFSVFSLFPFKMEDLTYFYKIAELSLPFRFHPDRLPLKPDGESYENWQTVYLALEKERIDSISQEMKEILFSSNQNLRYFIPRELKFIILSYLSPEDVYFLTQKFPDIEEFKNPCSEFWKFFYCRDISEYPLNTDNALLIIYDSKKNPTRTVIYPDLIWKKYPMIIFFSSAKYLDEYNIDYSFNGQKPKKYRFITYRKIYKIFLKFRKGMNFLNLGISTHFRIEADFIQEKQRFYFSIGAEKQISKDFISYTGPFIRDFILDSTILNNKNYIFNSFEISHIFLSFKELAMRGF